MSKDTFPHDNMPIANNEEVALCALIMDKSESMTGAPMDSLNQGFASMMAALRDDPVVSARLKLGIVTVGGTASIAQAFAHPDQLSPTTYTAEGDTPLGSGLELAMNMITAEVAAIRARGGSCTKPWLVVQSDGAPTDRWEAAAARAREMVNKGDLHLFVIGVGVNADMNVLGQITHPSLPPKRLDAVNYQEFFKWLKDSLHGASRSKPGQQLKLPPTSAWESITA